MAEYVALLRGINVGGKNKLPMKTLAQIFTDAGCSQVRTYIQSGNVVFGAGEALARKIPSLIPAAIEAQLGLEVPVIVRSAREWSALPKNNPFLRAGAAPETLHVAFLADAPSKSLIGALDPQRSPPDVFQVRGREIYLELPNGAGKSKLSNSWFDSKLKTVSTIRNWRTVLTLLEMLG